jgi:hypothetical protein
MAILKPVFVKPPAVTPTTDDLKAKSLQAVSLAANGALTNLVSLYWRLYQTIWADTSGLPPETVVAILGPDDTAIVLGLLTTVANAINSVQPDAIPSLPPLK